MIRVPAETVFKIARALHRASDLSKVSTDPAVFKAWGEIMAAKNSFDVWFVESMEPASVKITQPKEAA